MQFIARDEELRRLERKLSSDRSENILIYGRRRVGKSELVREAIRRTECVTVQYVGIKAPLQQNVQGLSTAVAEAFQEPWVRFANLQDVLLYVYQKAQKQRVILFLDEYPFFRNDDEAVDSALQVAIDSYQHDACLKLILCGSYMDTMQKIIEGGAPLFGRFAEIMQLRPMDYYDAAKFYPNRTDEEKVFLYSIFGGMPFYLSLLDDTLSPEDNVAELLLREGSILENEVRLQVTAELSKEENANVVLDAIAAGATKYADISQHFPGKNNSKMNYALNKLIGMGLVAKGSPINKVTDNKKQRYTITDNLLDFYYTYLFREGAARGALTAQQFYDRIRELVETQYVPRKFEQITQEYLLRQNRTNKIDPPFFAIGRFLYHDKEKHANGEFDVVTADERGYIAYECKYRQEPVSMATVRREEWQARELGLNFYRYGFVSRSGFTDDVDPEKYILLTLADLYA